MNLSLSDYWLWMGWNLEIRFVADVQLPTLNDVMTLLHNRYVIKRLSFFAFKTQVGLFRRTFQIFLPFVIYDISECDDYVIIIPQYKTKWWGKIFLSIWIWSKSKFSKLTSFFTVSSSFVRCSSLIPWRNSFPVLRYTS